MHKFASSNQVNFVTQYYGKARGGLGRYEEAILPLIRRNLQLNTIPIQPIHVPNWLATFGRLLGRDLLAFTENFPCVVSSPQKDILFHFPNQTLAASLLYHRLPQSVVTVHDIIPYVQLRENIKNKPQSIFSIPDVCVALWANGLKRADRIIADSNYTKQDLVSHLGIDENSIDVVYLGVDQQLYRPLDKSTVIQKLGLSPTNNYVLYVGSQDRRKNLVTLLQAISLLKSGYRNLVLLIVGKPRLSNNEGDHRASILQLSEERNIVDRVQFTGFVPEEQLPEYYSAADVCVVPSLYEGFGLPILEAMACGCPVISANATSLPEVAGDAATLVAPLDPNAFASAIGNVLDNRTQQLFMKQAGIQRAQEFTWEKTTRQTIQTYERIWDDNSTPT